MGVNIQMPTGDFPSEAGPEPMQTDEEKPNPEPEMTEEEQNEKDIHDRALKLKEEGNTLFKQQKYEDALEKYDEAVKSWPENIAFRNNKATVYSKLTQYEKCIEECENAIEIGRQNGANFASIATSFAKIGNAYFQMKNFDKAVDAFNHSLAEHRTPAVLKKLKEVETLLKEKEEREYLNPEIAQEEKAEGNKLFREGNYGEAMKRYTEAIRRDPNDHTFFSNRSQCYIKLGEFQLALKDAEQCLKLKPDFAKGYARKGNAYFGMKEFNKALSAFDEGMAVDPNLPDLKDGTQKVIMAIQREQSSGAMDPERARKAMEDPEIQAIMADPIFQGVLKQMNENPQAAAQFLQDPSIGEKISKLVTAGILKVG